MGKLSKEQADQLAALEAQRDSPDPDDSDEVSWYERTKDGERGATMRASRAKTHGPGWLREHLTDKDADDGAGDGGDGDSGQADPPTGTAGGTRRFQRRVS
jgi:hypothetical protein